MAIHSEFFRYLIVGGIAFVLDFTTLYLLVTLISWHYLIANVFAFLVGLGVNYFLSITWVFKTRKQEKKSKEFIIFALIGCVGLLINELVLWFGNDVLLISLMVSKLIATVVVFAWNFVIRKIVLF